MRDYLIHVVPFVDLDGVEDGDQGKSRKPHDHNRDYIDNPIYNSTGAIMKYISELKLNNLYAFDVHSPYKDTDHLYFAKRPDPINSRINSLSRIFEEVTQECIGKNTIVYNSTHNLEPNERWNAEELPTCSCFFEKAGARMSCTFEVPYFGKDIRYTQENLRMLGTDFSRALEIYLNQEKL